MNREIAFASTSLTTRTIYNEYAGLLLGYIYEVVKDKQLAEQYLLAVFNQLPGHINELSQPGVNIYLKLQLITRKVLAGVFETIPTCTIEHKSSVPERKNKFLDRMSEEEQLIFCHVHYGGKSIISLAAELNKSEEVIKKTLQRAFAAIRRSA